VCGLPGRFGYTPDGAEVECTDFLPISGPDGAFNYAFVTDKLAIPKLTKFLVTVSVVA